MKTVAHLGQTGDSGRRMRRWGRDPPGSGLRAIRSGCHGCLVRGQRPVSAESQRQLEKHSRSSVRAQIRLRGQNARQHFLADFMKTYWAAARPDMLARQETAERCR